ncbi:MAG: FG-GAP repeat protein [Bacteroidetes bacterium]|nr:FG-GAP repeat protein [Bacteroidota bacterium]
MRYFILAVLLLQPIWLLQNRSVQPEQQSAFHFKTGNTELPACFQTPKATTDTAALKQSNWYTNVMQSIAAEEYAIAFQPQYKSYSSPNRQQNLRAFYTADEFTMQPRNDSADQWTLRLKVKGIYAASTCIAAPVKDAAVTANGNTIRFDHQKFITEYVNSKDGVRQNFVINKKPAENVSNLSVHLQCNDGWFVNQVAGHEIHFAKADKDGYAKKLTYNDLHVWDATGKQLDAAFAVNGNNIAINVAAANAVYPVTIDPLSTTAAAMVESNQVNASLGLSAASAGDVNGDGYSDVIIGAPSYDNGQAGEGVAFIYHGSATGMSTTYAALLESNQANANFGVSVSGAGDVNGDGYNDVIVGADAYDNTQTNEGAAFVFHGSVAGVSTTYSTLIVSGQADARLGFSVAGAGDVNGDGYSDVIVGAKWYDNPQVDEGAAFVYHGSASGISNVYTTMMESNQAGASLGYSVAGAGDVNGDGYSDVVVGAYLYTNGQTNEGAAFVYHGSAAGISSTYTTMVESNQANADEGISVSTAGDVNGDGYSDIIVGAYLYDNGQTDEGVAYIYQGSAAGISSAYLTLLEVNQATASFGYSVACAGDVNGDGYSDVIVGAPLFDDPQTDEGAAFLFYGSSTGVSTTIKAQLESNQAGANLGWSVASAGDVNGDGYSDVVTGAPSYANGQAFEGAAYVYHGASDGVSTTAVVMSPVSQNLAAIGNCVASAGDVNSDGYSDVLISAPYYDGGFADEGRVFVYYGSATGLPGSPSLFLNDANQAGALFGYSCASAGDVNGDGYGDVVVSALYYTNGGNSQEGRAWVHYGSAAGLSATPARILSDAGQAGAYYGSGVACAGDVNGDGYSDVIVGASGYDVGGNTDEGRAYVYYGSATGLAATPSRTYDDANQPNSSFGSSVAGAGDVNGDGFCDVVIGAIRYDDGVSTDEGRAWVYYGSATGLSATPNRILDDANQAGAGFGSRVCSAGDVNGDGFSDVIVTAIFYDSQRGRGWVYYGSATGLSATPNRVLDNSAGPALSSLGYGVSSAGDLNGDGYSDIVIGLPQYSNAPYSEDGRAWIFYGSPTGLAATPDVIVNAATEDHEFFGISTACAGDVNGDGFSDIIVGADHGSWASSFGGRAYLFYGNATASGKRNNVKLYNIDLVTPIQQININVPNLFGAGIYAKSPLGRAKGKMVWEVKKQGLPFSGNPITNSTSFYDKQIAFTDLGTAGVELKNQVQKLDFQNKVRMRVEYSKATALTGQVYGPWRYPVGYLKGAYGMNALPLPVTLLSLNATPINDNDIRINWITATETALQSYIIERSTDGIHFDAVGTTAAAGTTLTRSQYSFVDTKGFAQSALVYYRLQLLEQNGNASYTKTVTVTKKVNNKFYVYPNPVQKGNAATVVISIQQNHLPVTITVFDLQGRKLLQQQQQLQSGKNQIDVATTNLSAGSYYVVLKYGGAVQQLPLVVQ